MKKLRASGDGILFIVFMLIYMVFLLMAHNSRFNHKKGEEKSVEPEYEENNIDTSYQDSIVYIDMERATRYNPSPSQCDDTPFHTADGSFINTSKLKKGEIRWCALSWDLIYDEYRQKVAYRDWAWKGDIEFGDTIYVESESKPFINGLWVVHDVMNPRYKNSIDFLFHKDNMNPKLGVCEDVKILLNSKS